MSDKSMFTRYILPGASTVMTYIEREQICLNPRYQRESDVWSDRKRKLLIDTIINGFDIPKLYFLEHPNDPKCRTYRYAVIDGKQRLKAIWDFMDGKFPLDEDFQFKEDLKVSAGGLFYEELADIHPKLKAKFDGYTLSITIIRTEDEEIIEEMFSRLNEGEPLSAPEKRNAMGGPIIRKIREIVDHRFFQSKIPFHNKRGKQWDVAAKFLFFEERDGIADTKREYLDQFVRRWKTVEKSDPAVANTRAKEFAKRTKKNLDVMAEVFQDKDPLLRSIGMVVLYYLLIRYAQKAKIRVEREKLVDFNKTRRRNREVAEKDYANAEWELLEFDRLSQSLNDASALKFRLEVISRYVLGEGVEAKIADPVKEPDALRARGDQE